MNCGGEQTPNHARKDIKPIPRTPIPLPHRLAISVGVMNVLKFHSSNAAYAHQDSAEKGQNEYAHKVFPPVAFQEPLHSVSSSPSGLETVTEVLPC